MSSDVIMDIIEEKINSFKGSNEAILHASQEIEKLIKIENVKSNIDLINRCFDSMGGVHFKSLKIILKQLEDELKQLEQ
jgi:hypothetical protein